MAGRKALLIRRMNKAIFILLAVVIFLGSLSAAPGYAESFSWQALQEAINQAEDGETVTLTKDVTAAAADTALLIPAGKSLILDLAGYTLDRSEENMVPFLGAVICVPSDAVLTIRSSGDTAGRITGGYTSDGGGIRNDGTLILEGGLITGNRAETAGGGIVNYGVLIVTGGRITGNTAGENGCFLHTTI